MANCRKSFEIDLDQSLSRVSTRSRYGVGMKEVVAKNLKSKSAYSDELRQAMDARYVTPRKSFLPTCLRLNQA